MAKVGNVEYPDSDVLPFRPVEAPNGDFTVLAGEIVKSGPHFGLLQDNASDGDVRGLVIRSHIRARKTTAAIVDNQPLTLVANPTGTKNDWWFRTAIATEAIHAYAEEAAPVNTTDVLVRMVEAPYSVL